MNNVIQFKSLRDESNEEDRLYNRKLELCNEWKEDPFTFLHLLGSKERKELAELMDFVFFEIMKRGDVLDKAYDVTRWVENKQDIIASEIAGGEDCK